MLPTLLPRTSKRSYSDLQLLLPSVKFIQQDLKVRKDLSNSQFDFICADMFLQLSSDLIHITKIQKPKQWLLCHSQCMSDWGLSPVPCPHELLTHAFLYKLEYNWTHPSAIKWKAITKWSWCRVVNSPLLLCTVRAFSSNHLLFKSTVCICSRPDVRKSK